MKKILSTLLSVAILLSTVPVVAQGATVRVASNTPCGFESSTGETFGTFEENYGALEQAVVTAIKDKKTSVDVTKFNFPVPEKGGYNALHDILYRNPEYFYAELPSYSYYESTGTVKSITITYTYEGKTLTASEIDTALAKQEAVVQQYLAGVDSSWSDEEKALYLHDEIVCNNTYDNTLTDHTMYGALVNGTSVCEGYAKAYLYLLKRVGVKSTYVTSEANHHAWNMVRINGEWYFADLTWDDPTGANAGNCSHNNFLITSAQLTKSNHKGEDWTSEGANVFLKPATTTVWSGFWTTASKSRLVYAGGKWYISSSDNKIYAVTYNRESKTDSKTAVATLSDKWYVFGNSSSYYSGNYTRLASVNNLVYYNTPTKLMCYNPHTGETTIELTLTASQKSEGYLYDVLRAGGNLVYHVAKSPAEVGKVYTVTPKHQHDWEVTTRAVAPTCTETGKTAVTTCKDCGTVQGGEIVKATGHSWDTGEVTTKPDCENTGTKTYHCTVQGCTGTKTETVKALGHSYTSKVVKPTYFAKGYTQYTCSGCGDLYKDKYTAKLVLKVPSVTKLSALKKGFKLTHKKVTGATGYQIQYSTSSKFSSAKTVKTTALTKSISKLKAKKKYYVRVRSYHTEKGKTVYSSWSTKKAVTTKK